MAQIVPGINTRLMSIIPRRLDSVITDHLNVCNLVRPRGRQYQDIFRVVFAAHVLMTTPALHARASLTQMRERVLADSLIAPDDLQVVFVLVQRDLLWSNCCLHHGVSRQKQKPVTLPAQLACYCPWSPSLIVYLLVWPGPVRSNAHGGCAPQSDDRQAAEPEHPGPARQDRRKL